MKRKRLTSAGSATKSTLAAAKGKKNPLELRTPAVNNRLDQKLIDKFCKYVAEGLPMDAVCDYLGVNQGNFWHWQRNGQRYIDGNNQPPEHQVYGVFVQMLRRATAQYRLGLVQDLHASKNVAGAWQGDMTILERRDRKSFGKREQMGGDDQQYDPDDRFL